jgi:hypothetical protein
VEVLPVDKRHVDRSTSELANRLQAPEAAPNDDDPVASGLTRRQRHRLLHAWILAASRQASCAELLSMQRARSVVAAPHRRTDHGLADIWLIPS